MLGGGLGITWLQPATLSKVLPLLRSTSKPVHANHALEIRSDELTRPHRLSVQLQGTAKRFEANEKVAEDLASAK